MTDKTNPYVTETERQPDELLAFRKGLISYESVPSQGFQPKPVTPKVGQRERWEPGVGIVENHWQYCSDCGEYTLHEQGNCLPCGINYFYAFDRHGMSR